MQEKFKELISRPEFAEQLIATAQVIVLVLDAEGKIIMFNPYMEELSGYRLGEVQGRDWFSTFLPPGDHEAVRAVFKKAIADIKTQGNVNPIITRDGQKRFIEWYDTTFKDPNGEAIGLLTIGQDVTDRMKVMDEMRRIEERYETVINNMEDLVFQVSFLGVIEFVSSKAQDMLGYPPEELIGKNLKKTTPLKEIPRALEAIKRIFSGEKVRNFQIQQMHRDGHIIATEVNAGLVRKEGKGIAAQGIMRDISERKKAEEEMASHLKDLQNFKQMTIGRENKMIDLKKEINKLSQELGRPAPHDLSFTGDDA